jgi:hypothetical protein
MRHILLSSVVLAFAFILSGAQLQAQIRTPTVVPPVGGQIGSVGSHLGTTPTLSTSLTPTGVPSVQLGPSSLSSGFSVPQMPTVNAVDGHSATGGHRPFGTLRAPTSTTPVDTPTWHTGSSAAPTATVDAELDSFRAVALHPGGEPPKDRDSDDGDSEEGQTKWWWWLLIVAIGIVIAARIRR